MDEYVTARGNTSILEMADRNVAAFVYPHAKPMKLILLIVLAIATIPVLVDTVANSPVQACDLVTYGHQHVWSLIKLIFCLKK